MTQPYEKLHSDILGNKGVLLVESVSDTLNRAWKEITSIERRGSDVQFWNLRMQVHRRLAQLLIELRGCF